MNWKPLLLAVGVALPSVASQLGAPPEWFEVPGQAGLYHLVQKTRDGRLALTPNEGFFPKLGLIAGGQGMVPDVDNLNGGQSFAHVGEWDPGDVVEWGLWLPARGKLSLRVRMSAGTAGGRFAIRLDDLTEEFELIATQPGPAAVVHEFECEVAESGRHLVRLENLTPPATDARLHGVEIVGPAGEGGAVLRKRWRPAAAHTGFSSSAAGDGVRMWIMEMDAVPGELGFYAPITTPFGYYGPTWLADGRVNTGMNFSLWSFGRNDPAPPVTELSHLLAIGDPGAAFGGFDHEGTGVKIRNWEPLAGRQGQRQAFALRVEPGADFNTYYSFFYAADERRWRLFGVGRQKPKRRPLTQLSVGSFVEVPGPPPRQRTGATVRRMRYRGWVSQDGSQWQPLDTMRAGDVDKDTGLTYTDRGLDADGWFFMQTGGWFFRKAPAGDVMRSQPVNETPDYLRHDAVKALLELPAGIETVAARRDGQRVVLDYRIRGAGKNPAAFVYWGESEGLTLAELWEKKLPLPTPQEGVNRVTIPVESAKALRLRLFLRNEQGQFWSFETAAVR